MQPHELCGRRRGAKGLLINKYDKNDFYPYPAILSLVRPVSAAAHPILIIPTAAASALLPIHEKAVMGTKTSWAHARIIHSASGMRPIIIWAVQGTKIWRALAGISPSTRRRI